MAAESAGFACAVLVSGVPVAVAVVACMCKFVKVGIKGRAYCMSPPSSLFLSSLP